MLNETLYAIAVGVEIAAVAVILIGAISATWIFLQGGPSRAGWSEAFRHYHANLGRGILLGLELLVAADIIGTVAVEPTIKNLAVLGLIVLIRTFLSFALQVEIEGCLPWRRHIVEVAMGRHSVGSPLGATSKAGKEQ
ncbi:DUF1622 domain-containing protein [Microvirga rosea]|uniref:DUF1622 domain-containing protein n=1 Tax=Microvirga rosea TaxID=2715425 RepID=UPI001D0AED05|nr:DUF1622 domain-containing protein [Microvirga rosea]MCB8821120.1 DUF1622 domain-containing protein [Microvirga rosea]